MTWRPPRFEVTPGDWDPGRASRRPLIAAVRIEESPYAWSNGWHATLADADEALLRGVRSEPVGAPIEFGYRVSWDDRSEQRGILRFDDSKAPPASGWLRSHLEADVAIARASSRPEVRAWGEALAERLRLDDHMRASRFAFASSSGVTAKDRGIVAVRLGRAGSPLDRYATLEQADIALARFRLPDGRWQAVGICAVIEWGDGMSAPFFLNFSWLDDGDGSDVGRACLQHAGAVLSDTYPWPDVDQRRAWAEELRRRIGAAMVSGRVGAAPRPAPRAPRNAWSGDPLLRLPGGADHLGPRDVVRDPDGAIGALLNDVGLGRDHAATVREVYQAANRITVSLRASLPTADRYDTIAIWDAWGRALRAIRDERKAHAMDAPYPMPALFTASIELLRDQLRAARDQPGRVWARYCPWKADFATRRRLYPEAS